MSEFFQVGQVWLSPKGYFHKVVSVEGVNVTMRAGKYGNGRKTKRNKYAIGGWTIHTEELTQ